MPGPLDLSYDLTTVHAEQGLVLLDGPGGAIVSLTPDGALVMAEKLLRSANQARAAVTPLVIPGATPQA